METRTVLAPPRRIGVDQVDEVGALVDACDIEVVGSPDYTRIELEADLRSATATHLGWYDVAGLLAYGWFEPAENSNKVGLDLYVRPGADGALGEAALAQLEDRGRASAAVSGHAEVHFDTGAYRQDERTGARLRARGFEVATTFARMRLDLAPGGSSAAADAETDPGLQIREVAVAAADDADLRQVHRIWEESFTDHYGHVPESFDRWRRRLSEQAPDWSRIWLASLDGEPVAELVGTRQFEADEDAGYVRTLGVLPAARGRGVAKALLRNYFAVSAAAGRRAVLLHVDVANTTNALRLYESVGMRQFRMIDAWAKRAPTASG
jgi:mycothiol synthase